MRAMMSALAHARRPAVMTAVALVLVAVNSLVALASPRTNSADLCAEAAGASNPIAAEIRAWARAIGWPSIPLGLTTPSKATPIP